MNQRASVLVHNIAENSLHSHFSERRVVVKVSDDLPAQHPEVVHMAANGLGGKSRQGQVLDERPQASQQLCARRQVFVQAHPGAGPVVQIAAIGGDIGGRHRLGGVVYSGSLRLRNRPRHGTDHDSKPLPPPSGVCISARPFQPRQEDHRSELAAATG